MRTLDVNRSKRKGVRSIVGGTPLTISATTFPAPGPMPKPWPLKPVAKKKPGIAGTGEITGKATAAIARAAERQGVNILTDCAVRTVETSGGSVSHVVTERGTIATRIPCVPIMPPPMMDHMRIWRQMEEIGKIPDKADYFT